MSNKQFVDSWTYTIRLETTNDISSLLNKADGRERERIYNWSVSVDSTFVARQWLNMQKFIEFNNKLKQ